MQGPPRHQTSAAGAGTGSRMISVRQKGSEFPFLKTTKHIVKTRSGTRAGRVTNRNTYVALQGPFDRYTACYPTCRIRGAKTNIRYSIHI